MRKSILIVDDNVDLADGLVLVLEDDYEAVVSYSAEDALDKLANRSFDWVLSDVKMPGMNGVQLKRILAEKYPQTRVMLMSGFRVEQLVEEVLDVAPVLVKREVASASELDELLKEAAPKGVLVLDSTKSPTLEEIRQSLLQSGWNIHQITPAGAEQIGGSEDKRVQLIAGCNTVVDALVLCLRQGVESQPPLIIICDMANQTFSDEDPFKSYQVTGCLFKPFYFDKVFELLEA